MTEEEKEQQEDLEKPLEVIVKNPFKPEEPKNPTSEDTLDEYSVLVTEEEIKEMQDAQ